MLGSSRVTGTVEQQSLAGCGPDPRARARGWSLTDSGDKHWPAIPAAASLYKFPAAFNWGRYFIWTAKKKGVNGGPVSKNIESENAQH